MRSLPSRSTVILTAVPGGIEPILLARSASLEIGRPKKMPATNNAYFATPLRRTMSEVKMGDIRSDGLDFHA